MMIARPFAKPMVITVLAAMAMLGGRLPGGQPPKPRAKRRRGELLGEVGVLDPHLVRRAPEGVGGIEPAVGHLSIPLRGLDPPPPVGTDG